MESKSQREWLLLIHQLPPTPNALRVKIWRRLQQVGAVAIKPSVYAMPLAAQSREDLSWILREIVAGGGDGSILEARFVEGLTDEELIALFLDARKTDYEKISQEAEQIMSGWSAEQADALDPAAKSQLGSAKLRRRLEDTVAIDFFQAPERAKAESLLKELLTRVVGERAALANSALRSMPDLQGRTWVTRQNIFVDRLACVWLIRRFVDRGAIFKLVRGTQYLPQPGELRFDMFEGEFTHEGDRCTFEVMIQRLQLGETALGAMAEVIHDIDMKDNKFGRSETNGFQALLTGLVASQLDDYQRMDESARLFDNLYAYFQRSHNDPALASIA